MQHQQGKGHGRCLVCDDACRSAFADYIHTHIYTNTTSYPRVSLRSCSISLKAGPQVVIHLNLQQHLLLRPWFHLNDSSYFQSALCFWLCIVFALFLLFLHLDWIHTYSISIYICTCFLSWPQVCVCMCVEETLIKDSRLFTHSC